MTTGTEVRLVILKTGTMHRARKVSRYCITDCSLKTYNMDGGDVMVYLPDEGIFSLPDSKPCKSCFPDDIMTEGKEGTTE